LSKQQRWLGVRVLHGGDDGVVVGGDPDEVLRLGGGTRSLGSGKAMTFLPNPGKAALHRSSRVAEGVINEGGRWRATSLQGRESAGGQKGGKGGGLDGSLAEGGCGVWRKKEIARGVWFGLA
jgi:hypothetical protein